MSYTHFSVIERGKLEHLEGRQEPSVENLNGIERLKLTKPRKLKMPMLPEEKDRNHVASGIRSWPTRSKRTLKRPIRLSKSSTVASAKEFRP